MRRVKVLIGLGANVSGPIGPPEQTLRWACSRLQAMLDEARVSSLLRSDPHHRSDQPRYCNQVVLGFTLLAPHRLLDALHALEREGGRNRTREVRFGPRSLDLDILTYGDFILASADLLIPHPRMHQRPFVMEPLLELDPRAIDPRSGSPWTAPFRERSSRYGPAGTERVY